MVTRRILLGSGVILLAALLGVAWIHGGEDHSDGAQALANTSRLRPGMTIADVLRTVHPTRLRSGHGFSYSQHPVGKNEVCFHSLTSDRYLTLISASGPDSNKILAWKLESGRPPREDVVLGRSVSVGSLRFRY